MRSVLSIAALGALAMTGCTRLSPEPTLAPVISEQPDSEGRRIITFRHRPEQPVEHVCVAGDFNGWDPTALEMTDPDGDGILEATASVHEGRQCYKLVLNGTDWIADPANPAREPGGYQNSILYAGVDPADYPEDREPPPPPRPEHWLPESEQTEPTPRGRRDRTARFRLPDDGFESVCVTGDFNGWTGQLDQLTLDPSTPEWRLDLAMSEHPIYQYRFVVAKDGATTTIPDPRNPNITFNGHPVDSVGHIDECLPFPGPQGVVQIASPSLTATTSTCEARPIHVWLPPGYSTQTTVRYPVLYMHDGQNVLDDPVNPFGFGGWQANLTAAALIASGEITPFILVAVPNSEQRMAEYGPGEDVFDASDHPYARYLIDDVMPLINSRYRTLTGPENTSLMGSSMGGLISLFLAWHHPEVFGQAACLSTAFSIPDTRGHTLSDLVSAEGHRPIRVYLDSGTGGEYEDGAPATREVRDLMAGRGWTIGEDLVWFQEEGALHNERAWRSRLWRPLTFLFGRGDTQP